MLQTNINLENKHGCRLFLEIIFIQSFLSRSFPVQLDRIFPLPVKLYLVNIFKVLSNSRSLARTQEKNKYTEWNYWLKLYRWNYLATHVSFVKHSFCYGVDLRLISTFRFSQGGRLSCYFNLKWKLSPTEYLFPLTINDAFTRKPVFLPESRKCD